MLRTKLSVMMFLEFFIWGAWLPIIFGYLPTRFSAKASEDVLSMFPEKLLTIPLEPVVNAFFSEQSWILNAFAIASFVGMFFSNQFADRTFAAEKFLAVSHFIGGLAFIGLYWATGFWSFFGLMLIHCLFYVPTISITNAIAFANLKDPANEFGPVRLWGTIGWIAAAWPYVLAPARENMFFLAGGASILLAVFSLALPHTPPKPIKSGESSLAWLEAAKYLKHPFILVLYVVTFIDAMVHQGYFVLTETYLQDIGISARFTSTVMSVGQIAEIFTMAILGYFLKSLGWRKTMVIGILGHTIRFGVFALLPNSVPVVASILLHGVCYAFFFATVYIFIDEFLPKDARSSAQGLFNFLILGLGPFIGNVVWPAVMDQHKTSKVDVAAVAAADGKYELVAKGAIPLADQSYDLSYKFTPPISEDQKDTSTASQRLMAVFDNLFKAAADDSKDYTAPVTLKSGLSEQVTLGEAKPGKYTFKPLKLKPRLWIFGETEEYLRIPDLELKADFKEKLKDAKVTGALPDYQRMFLYPSGTALVAAILLVLFFYPPQTPTTEKKAPTALAH